MQLEHQLVLLRLGHLARASALCALIAASLFGCERVEEHSSARLVLEESEQYRPFPRHLTVEPATLADPNDPSLRDAAQDAYARWHRERWERFVDDIDIGELHEDMAVSQSDIEAGKWGIDQLFAIGDEIFERSIRPGRGFGRGQSPGQGQPAGRHAVTQLRRVHEGLLGGPDAGSCNDCHHRGGPDGAGDLTQNAFVNGDGFRIDSANERNPPPLLGLGVIQRLAEEMTQELQQRFDIAEQTAKAQKRAVEVGMGAKGVSFGRLIVNADGSIDASQLVGVDPDLVVKPFGWKGNHRSLRTFATEALQAHHNLITEELQYRNETDPIPEIVGAGPSYDPDADGTYVDFSTGQLTALQLYMALLELPVIRPPRSPDGQAMYLAGAERFEEFGCADCHRPTLFLQDDTYRVDSGELRTKTLEVKLTEHMEEPALRRDDAFTRGYAVRLFSDLKRHDMGPGLAENKPQGTIPASHFRTPALWGLSVSGPFLHDGRAATVDEAILAHGGEASESATKFAEADLKAKAELRVFLMSLTREPKLMYR